MDKSVRKRSKKTAQSPGSLIHVGEKKSEFTTITQIRYNLSLYEDKPLHSPAEIIKGKDFDGVCWYIASGIHDVDHVATITTLFGIHSLIVEDILNTMQRPKQEDLGDYVFVVLKILEYNANEKEIKSDQVSFILGDNYVLMFQERESGIFKPVQERIRLGKGRSRKMGADYLLYSLIDTVVDNYFVVLEAIGEDIEKLEETLLTDPSPQILQIVHKLKREMLFLRRAVWPVRELLNGLLKAESPLIRDTTHIFLSDIYDHTIQVIDTAETFRDMVWGLQDLYLSSISNKTNEVMKVLTIIATIFIPLTFFAGVYGMNFEVMPELKWRFGYFLIWGIMIVSALVMAYLFKRKKWF